MNRSTPMKPEDDVRETPPELYAAQNARFRFTLDACATHANAKCGLYFTEEGKFFRGQLRDTLDGLRGSWRGERVWCNPPFSDIGAWVLKAWESEAESVCMLVPATRTEQSWWQVGVEPFRDGKSVLEFSMLHLHTEFLHGRIHFLKDGLPIINPKTGKRSSPKFGCALLVWRS